MYSLAQHRSKDAAVADLLNYAAEVDDGIVVCKNGSFLAAWMYQGEDNASSTDEQREVVSMRINQALAGLGSGWMIHVDAVRKGSPHYSDPRLSHFPDPVTAAIDEERRNLFESLGTMFEGYFVLTLTYFPPLLAQAKFVELMFDDEGEAPDHKARTKNLVESFKREIASIESRLSTALKMRRLLSQKVVTEEGTTVSHDELLQWLHYCVTGVNHPIVLPSHPMYLDAIIGGKEMFGGVIPIALYTSPLIE